jgi:hypothetical protein
MKGGKYMMLNNKQIAEIKEYLTRSMKVTASSLIPRISKHGLDLINTIEVLEQENKQLQTKLKDWKYETQCHIDEVIAREKEIERLQIQIASMKKALNLILGYSKNGCIYFIEEIAKEALSEDVTEKYHNPADITLLRKAKDCLKQGIKQLEKYINRFEQTPEEDACIEMHETVLEIDKILGGMDK